MDRRMEEEMRAKKGQAGGRLIVSPAGPFSPSLVRCLLLLGKPLSGRRGEKSRAICKDAGEWLCVDQTHVILIVRLIIQ